MAQPFYDFLKCYIKEHGIKTVAEVGSDIQLKLALHVAPACETFYSVNFPEHHRMMRGWLEMHEKMAGVYNIELRSGNAVDLSTLVERADLTVFQNVFVAPSDEDMILRLRYARGEESCTEEQWAASQAKFDMAQVRCVREAIKISTPGHIVLFGPKEQNYHTILKYAGVTPARIRKREFSYDDTDIVWPAYIVKN